LISIVNVLGNLGLIPLSRSSILIVWTPSWIFWIYEVSISVTKWSFYLSNSITFFISFPKKLILILFPSKSTTFGD
jgi:hypothetical protein